MTDEGFRTYKLPVRTCRQIDYLSLVTDQKKTQVIENAVDLLFIMHTVIPDEIKDMITQISSTESEEDLFCMMKDYLLKKINEPFAKEAL